MENPEYQNPDEHTHHEEVRTDVHCHACGKSFVAELDFLLEGNHKIECPYCCHIHYRVIKKGKITEDRFSHCYDSGPERRDHLPLRVWKHDVLTMQTSTASDFIRAKWLERLT